MECRVFRTEDWGSGGKTWGRSSSLETVNRKFAIRNSKFDIPQGGLSGQLLQQEAGLLGLVEIGIEEQGTLNGGHRLVGAALRMGDEP